MMHLSYSLVTVVWAAVFNQLFGNRMSQLRQEWGMTDFEHSGGAQRVNYRPELEETWTNTFKNALSYIIMLIFCLAFVGIIAFLQYQRKNDMEQQNHRTQARFEDALTVMLCVVKIFVTLWNFIYMAFIKRLEPSCESTIEEVTNNIWGKAFTGLN